MGEKQKTGQMPTAAGPCWFVGLMSGTSLDGVDAVLARFSPLAATPEPAEIAGVQRLRVETGGHVHVPFSPELTSELRSLNASGPDELRRAALAQNALAAVYAQTVLQLCEKTGVARQDIAALGVHGQTVRHQPRGPLLERYTIQLNNPSLLAERTAIAVVADFRCRDMAAGGQGAPLASGFHLAVFGTPGEGVAVLNLGGIANFSLLSADGGVIGLDCGPANTLMDAWCLAHTGHGFDEAGRWAAGGTVIDGLLECFLDEPYFSLPAPKSTGVDLFNLQWLKARLAGFADVRAQDVQATLAELTALSCAKAFARYRQGQCRIGVCGGGARNRLVIERLKKHVGAGVQVCATSEWGLEPEQVEACAFAWLARQRMLGQPGNVPAVTQADGPRVLGAIYAA